ncbi:hypothetical protein [uncultured Roseobacter sp.]|uniref:hypothetical protein n=1 Tax=uncultured Roseobacter sp. TaxID=114847 RepID=UPI0026178474|nr:hypothetical protein [uncultured Roseobacter sp.]
MAQTDKARVVRTLFDAPPGAISHFSVMAEETDGQDAGSPIIAGSIMQEVAGTGSARPILWPVTLAGFLHIRVRPHQDTRQSRPGGSAEIRGSFMVGLARGSANHPRIVRRKGFGKASDCRRNGLP